MSDKSTIKIYGAGGCGINMASKFNNFGQKDGLPNIEVVYLNAGAGDFPEDATEEQCKNLTDTEGSGKVRNFNAPVIAQKTPDILTTHAPATFNIIVFSAGGGSGSTIGPLLSREMVRKEIPHVIIVIGDNGSDKHAVNTYKTYLTLEHINQCLKLPIVLSWHKNCVETPRSVVDKNVHDEILNLAKLASGHNRELDTRDLANWGYYTRANEDLIPQLSLLTVTTDASAVSKIKNPLSVAHLMKVDSPLPKDFIPVVYFPAFLPETETTNENGIYYVISTDEISDLSKTVLEDHLKMSEMTKARIKANPKLVKETDTVSEDGLIF